MIVWDIFFCRQDTKSAKVGGEEFVISIRLRLLKKQIKKISALKTWCLWRLGGSTVLLIQMIHMKHAINCRAILVVEFLGEFTVNFWMKTRTKNERELGTTP